MKKPKYLSDYMNNKEGFPNGESATFKGNPLDSIKSMRKKLQEQRKKHNSISIPLIQP